MHLRNWLYEWKGRQFKRRAGPATSLDEVSPGNLSTVSSNRDSGDSKHFAGGSGASGPSEAKPTKANTPQRARTSLEPTNDETLPSDASLKVGTGLSQMYDLWDRAYELLKAKDEKLVSRYESILAKELRASNASQMLITASFGPSAGLGVSGPVLRRALTKTSD